MSGKVIPFKKPPRGIANCNPLNIDFSTSNKWLGLADPPTDGRFCRFIEPKYGIRAGCILLRTYQRKYGLDTIQAIINRWAPPHENDSSTYAHNVARYAGIGLGQRIDLWEDAALMRLVLKAMIRQENGQNPYEDDVIDAGMKLAGIRVSKEPA